MSSIFSVACTTKILNSVILRDVYVSPSLKKADEDCTIRSWYSRLNYGVIRFLNSLKRLSLSAAFCVAYIAYILNNVSILDAYVSAKQTDTERFWVLHNKMS
jgi:hypothetical protein